MIREASSIVKSNSFKNPNIPKPDTEVNCRVSKVKSMGSKERLTVYPDLSGIGVANSILKVAYSWTV